MNTMKKTFISGNYEIHWRGRGVVRVALTEAQARAMFEVHEKIPHEFSGINLSEEDLQKYFNN